MFLQDEKCMKILKAQYFPTNTSMLLYIKMKEENIPEWF